MLMRRVHQLLLDVQVGRFSFVVVTLSITNNFRSADITKMSTKKGSSTIYRNKEITNNTIFYSDLSFMSQFEKNRDDVTNRLF